MVAKGGKGGWGNVHFASSINQAPEIAQKGEPGEAREIVLEMRLIADVGIIGYPNAGKSTLLAGVSAAHPKIANYPFTTLEPVPGVVEVGRERFIMAEVPGLIEDAHIGRGLGHEFLRHAMRTRILVHLVSAESETPAEDMARVNNELYWYDASLTARPQIVAVNKVDLPGVQERLPEIQESFRSAGIKPHFISAITGRGVPEMLAAVVKLLKKPAPAPAESPKTRKVFRPRPADAGITVKREDGTYVISAPGLERLVAARGISGARMYEQLKQRLARMGVNKALIKAGVKPGDKVRCGDIEWEWY